uniref:Uncharacterized protein n=1 Tax=Oryza rufipogon TaxID=4529 RepID=A0A0E0NHG8_ORYRU
MLGDDSDEIRPPRALLGLLRRRLARHRRRHARHRILPDLAAGGPDPPTTAPDLAPLTGDGKEGERDGGGCRRWERRPSSSSSRPPATREASGGGGERERPVRR